MNSTPSRPTSAIRLTALPPPPPTPTTLMRAPARVSSASFSRNGVSRISAIFPPPVRLRLEEFLKQPAQPAGHASKCAGANHPAAVAYMIPLRVQHETDRRGELGIADVIGQTAYADRYAASNRQIKYLLGDLGHPFENRAASRQHDAGVE